MIISAIVAVGTKGAIGLDNQIPWYLPADLKYFKKTTIDHHILMGRKCYNSIGRPLPNRTNVIVTRDPFFIVSNCLIAHSIEEGIYVAKERGEQELFIIGGGEIYAQSLPYWNRIYITEVDYNGPADVFFPEVDLKNWKKVFEEKHSVDKLNNLAYSFITYERTL
jgi:dihydrofolate reductase